MEVTTWVQKVEVTTWVKVEVMEDVSPCPGLKTEYEPATTRWANANPEPTSAPPAGSDPAESQGRSRSFTYVAYVCRLNEVEA